VVLAQTFPTPEVLIGVFTPIAVWIASWLVNKIKGGFGGTIFLMLVVPATSALVTWITSLLLNPTLAWGWQFLLGVSSIILNEIIKQMNQSSKGTNKVKTNLIG